MHEYDVQTLPTRKSPARPNHLFPTRARSLHRLEFHLLDKTPDIRESAPVFAVQEVLPGKEVALDARRHPGINMTIRKSMPIPTFISVQASVSIWNEARIFTSAFYTPASQRHTPRA